jgi:hypothetical protein
VTIQLLDHCAGTGAADDAPGFAAALALAAASHDVIVSPPGRTYLIAAPLVVTAPLRLALAGSSIRKAPTLNATALTVQAPGVQARDFTLDGNRTAGARGWGISFAAGATAGLLRDLQVEHCAGEGVAALTGAALRCENVQSCFNDGGGGPSGAGDGFLCQAGASLSTDARCLAQGNVRAGWYLAAGMQPGCWIDGRAVANALGFYALGVDALHSRYLYAEGNHQFGLHLSELTRAGLGSVVARLNGAAGYGFPLNTAGTGVELYGCARCTVMELVAYGHPGYGLAINDSDLTPGLASTANSFGWVNCDQFDAGDGDPAVQIGGASAHNSIHGLTVRKHSWAVSFGETPGTAQTDNHIGSIFAEGCAYGVVKFGSGARNHVGRIIARDCGTKDPTLAKGLVEFRGGATQGNVVEFLEHRRTTPTLALPLYLAHADALATSNAVMLGLRGDAQQPFLDENGSNSL